MTVNILLVEDDQALREALLDTLLLEGYRCRAVASAAKALQALTEEAFNLVVSDVNMPNMDGHELLAKVRAQYPHLPFLLMTAFGTVERAIEAIRAGAADYVVKPFEPKVLLKLVAKYALGFVVPTAADAPVACAAQSIRLLELAAKIAQADSTVLISGESGTGKEVLAQFIHQRSARATQPFVAINCAAIPDNMLEAILFGHEKGAFTGAINAQPGKFELAQGGTLLLDEITEMPLALQAKLLRVLQEREVERVGGHKPLRLDIRVIATSNRDLRAEVAAGRFREDLFYRLSVLPLAWPPLRERVADILPLAERLLAQHAAKMCRGVVQFSDAARSALQAYAWPGNVRELDNAVQRALILQRQGQIEPEDLCLDGVLSLAPKAGVEPVGQLDKPESAAALGEDLRRHEYQVIIETLKSERGRRKETAEKLGISARTLRYKLAQMRDAGFDVEGQLFAS